MHSHPFDHLRAYGARPRHEGGPVTHDTARFGAKDHAAIKWTEDPIQMLQKRPRIRELIYDRVRGWHLQWWPGSFHSGIMVFRGILQHVGHGHARHEILTIQRGQLLDVSSRLCLCIIFTFRLWWTRIEDNCIARALPIRPHHKLMVNWNSQLYACRAVATRLHDQCHELCARYQ